MDAIVFVGVEPLLGEYDAACRSAGVPFTYIATRPGRAWEAWPAIHAALKRLRPDAIILHSVKTILPCALYARRHRVPLIAVEHQSNGLKKRSEWWVSRLLMRLADRVVVLTEEYRAHLRDGLGRAWRPDKVVVVPNGVDTEAFRPASVQHAPGAPRVIGMASRLTDIKRHDLLIEALALLRERDGPDAWRLTLAGDGDTLSALRHRASQLGLEGCIDFPGYLGEAALQAWFGSLDIYAHASEGETLSTSLLQALAMGLPIVGSNVPGIGNLLAAGGGCGIAVAQTAEEFAEAFRRIARTPALAADLRRRARSLALAEYSQATMFQRYDSLVRKTCAR